MNTVAVQNTNIVVATCADAPKLKGNQAEVAMRRLVDGCDKPPKGGAHFAATLSPDGRILISAPNGDDAQATIPICVLRHELRHDFRLTKPCTFDVQMQEQGVAAPAMRAEAVTR